MVGDIPYRFTRMSNLSNQESNKNPNEPALKLVLDKSVQTDSLLTQDHLEDWARFLYSQYKKQKRLAKNNEEE